MANRNLAKSHEETCVLVTGGAGFIGSHTCVELLNQGYRVVIVDDLSNSSAVAVDRVRSITGLAADDDRLAFYEANILDRSALAAIFEENEIDAIIHFAGFKAVGESVQKPARILLEQLRGHAGPVRGRARPWREEHRILVERHRVRRAGVHSHHRRLPEARRDQPLRLDEKACSSRC